LVLMSVTIARNSNQTQKENKESIGTIRIPQHKSEIVTVYIVKSQ